MVGDGDLEMGVPNKWKCFASSLVGRFNIFRAEVICFVVTDEERREERRERKREEKKEVQEKVQTSARPRKIK